MKGVFIMKELLKIKDLKNELNLGDYGEDITNYSSGYVSDIINEIVENYIDIYTYDLFEWAKGNTYYIDRAVDELGRPDTIEDEIRQGQYIAYQEDLYNNIEDILKYWAYDYIENKYNITELTEEQNDEINFYNYTNVDRLEEIKRMIEDIFESLEV